MKGLIPHHNNDYPYIYSSANIGLGGALLILNVTWSKSLPSTVVVGLANKSVDESKERVRSAIVNSDFLMPRHRITLNLAPADLPKEGSGYDLGMALAILTASDQLRYSLTKNMLFIGEFALDGSVRRVPAILSHIKTARS